MRIYCATLDKDCSPHYFVDKQHALEYIENNSEDKEINWNVVYDTYSCEVGWVQTITPEDK